MHDRGLVPVEEPFKKLINQGMILGESARLNKLRMYVGTKNNHTYDKDINQALFNCEGLLNVSEKFFQLNFIQIGENIFVEKNININSIKDLLSQYLEKAPNTKILEKLSQSIKEADFNVYYELHKPYVPVKFVTSSNNLIMGSYKNSLVENNNSDLNYELWVDDLGNYYGAISEKLNNINFLLSREVEKMSKSKYNVVSPDAVCEQYGADTLRMYEMFLGPLEQAKPWNTAGITGVHGFLKKLWKLYHSGENESFNVSEKVASKDSLKTLHKTIKKVEEDIENFSFNTSVSSFMISVNELTAQNCNSREILESLAILISSYAPHIAEELWEKLGHTESISTAPFPKFEQKYLVESSKEYPISFNGKMRFTLELPLDLSKEEIESAVMTHEKTAQYLEGRTPKKIIIVPGKIVNIVG